MSAMDNLDAILRLLVRDEPVASYESVSAPSIDRPLAMGIAVPLLLPHYRSTEEGLSIPMLVAEPQPIDFLATYITLNDYRPPGRPISEQEVTQIVSLLASIGPFHQRITNAAVLNDAIQNLDDLAFLVKDYQTYLPPTIAQGLGNRL